ncbi:class I SAM-dependent methyltransferase [Streptomyces hundungensis]|uniref:class I SAM-dependent methyltransferase n=1 Tax=Streptomyces hundungensis TaxID=1077946 RepID=UPI0034051C00
MIINEQATAPHWDRAYSRGQTFLKVSREELEYFELYVKVAPGMTAIDIGCGKGAWARRLAGLGLSVTGFDFSAVAVAEASRLTRGDNPQFLQWDVTSDATPPVLEPHSVDIVSCRLVAAFLPMREFLGRAAGWLKPNGVVHIVTPVHEHLDPAQKHRGMTEDQIAELGDGWRHVSRYKVTLDGAITAVVLQHRTT